MSAPKIVNTGAVHVLRNEIIGLAFCQSLDGFDRVSPTVVVESVLPSIAAHN